MPYLELKNISKAFNTGSIDLPVLNKISLMLYKKEFISIVGPSGCGKSTLLDIISGLTIPDSGEIYLSGKFQANRKSLCAYMMQDDILLPWKNVRQNITLPLEINRNNSQVSKSAFISLAKQFGLENFLNFFPDNLSGGMKQRVSLLRCFVQNKELVLLDEPFGKLDALSRIKMQMWFIRIWQKNRLSVLMVTHDIEEAIFLSDRIYVMSPLPGTIIKEIKIRFSRPRKYDLLVSKEFNKIKSRVMKVLLLHN